MRRSRLDALICAQEQMTSLSRAEIEAMQLRKLNALLQKEHDRQGFYRDLPASLRSLAELAALPFTTAADLAAHGNTMLLLSQSAVERVVTERTSGTTGAAKRLFYTAGDLERTVQLFEAGLGELIFPGSTTMICFPFSGPNGLGELIAAAIERLGARPIRVGVGRSYAELADILERERPDTFVGMPAPLLSLLRVCGRGSLRRALVSGDACPEAVLEGIEEILGTQLFPHYGSREMALGGAITCQAHAGMHLRENHVIAEIVSPEGAPLPTGEWGELVITTIGMEALPLIRYRTGDRARVLPGPCPCGSELCRLDTVSRLDAAAFLQLENAVFALPWVADYRAVRKPDGLHLEARTCAEPPAALPNLGAVWRLRPVRPEDQALIPGKRGIAEET
ncbi:MAG: AMP-binding protein [Oscillospiraceae bacterium]|nr:AMP-binding protein [Oscillospiraceae bacterium]MBQ6403465.1 AMP-binding protein [Oscillospiraceae bacterium]